MEEDDVMLDAVYKGNVWCTPQERKDWRVYLTDLISDPKNHIEGLDIIREAGEDDVIEILITSPGGNIDLADMYVSAMSDSKAKIITRAIGLCASAATTIFLSGDERVCDPGCYFMFHNVQFTNSGGDAANVFGSAKFYERLFKEKYYGLMSEVLNPDELSELFDRAGEIYLTGREMEERFAAGEQATEQSPSYTDIVMGNFKSPINLPVKQIEVPLATQFESRDDFDITLECGYSKTLHLGSIHPKDFDEFNMEEISEIGDCFGCDLDGLSRSEALEELISAILSGGGR